MTTTKLGFAAAVRERGDSWLFSFVPEPHPKQPVMSAVTWCAMHESGGKERKEALRMNLCETSEGRLFQLEQPLYRCGCDGLCPRHPECPGVVYQQDFPYQRGAK